MAELNLTEDRRAELADLLGDELRLRAEYPKAADYLSTAAMLPGSRDRRAEAAFDLRMVHYLTGGTSEIGNPYWDIVAPLVFERAGRRTVNSGSANGSARLGYAQTVLHEAYAYAIPSPETITWLSEFCSGTPIVELGAGRGYWAAQLAATGSQISAYDSDPPDKTENVSFPRCAGLRDVWHRIEGPSEYTERISGRSDHVLLLIWPPGWGNSMASEALAAFQQADGERLVYIGEPKGGKTGDDAFFDALAKDWELKSQDSQFVSWWNLADTAQSWVRRR